MRVGDAAVGRLVARSARFQVRNNIEHQRSGKSTRSPVQDGIHVVPLGALLVLGRQWIATEEMKREDCLTQKVTEQSAKRKKQNDEKDLLSFNPRTPTNEEVNVAQHLAVEMVAQPMTTRAPHHINQVKDFEAPFNSIADMNFLPVQVSCVTLS